jgi:hypothetical protein
MDVTRVLPALFAATIFAVPATASAQWASSPTVIIVNSSPAIGNDGGWGPGVATTAWGGGCGAGWGGGCGAGWGGGCGGGCDAGWGGGWGSSGLGPAPGVVVGTALAAAPYYGGYGYGSGSGYDPGYGSGSGYDPGYGSGYGYDPGYGSGSGYDPGYGSGYGYDPGYGSGSGYSPGYSRYPSRPYSRYRHYYGGARPVYRAHAHVPPQVE